MNVNKKPLCVILGAGGHAKVVIDCMEQSALAIPYAVLDANPALWGKEIFGVPIRGGDKLLSELKQEGVTHFIPGVGGIRDNEPRRHVFEIGLASGLQPLTLIHPSAIRSRRITIGRGTVIFAGVILNPGVVVGDNCIINTGAILDHDCLIEDHVHIATGAKLSGTVRVGKDAHIGTGALVRNNICIGANAVVGAGAVVVSDVLPNTVVKGVPAK